MNCYPQKRKNTEFSVFFFNEAHLAVHEASYEATHEAAFGYEACQRHTSIQ